MSKHRALLHDPALPKPDFAPIRALLGDLMPELAPGPHGRQRLSLALTQRFGENYRTNALAQQAIAHFDGETEKLRKWLSHKGVGNG